MLDRREASFLAALHSLGFSHTSLRTLNKKHHSFQDAFLWFTSSDIPSSEDSSNQTAREILKKRDALDIQKISDTLDRGHIWLIMNSDDEYPPLLKTLTRAPFFLYIKGNIPKTPFLSVVWSRKSTEYSRLVLEHLLPDAIRAGISVVSWGAAWVDALAHEITMKYGWQTIAIFGTGINRVYPAHHKTLFAEIVTNGGAVLSPFPLDAAGMPYNFPVRNAIVAGMSRALLVTEAGKSSWTLITASLALEYSREVFAVPGNIFSSLSIGTNGLLVRGEAKAITRSEDILEEYAITAKQTSLDMPVMNTRFDPIEQKILDILGTSEGSLEYMIQSMDTPLPHILAALGMLEIEGLIVRAGTGVYRMS